MLFRSWAVDRGLPSPISAIGKGYRSIINENHLVICAGEGKSASAAIALYTSLQKAVDEEDLPVRLHIKKLESAFLREMSPIVLTAPTEAIYINVRACDAVNIVRRTILKGEILEALTYQDSAGVTSRSLSVKELTDLAAENEPIASRSDEDLPDPIALLIPGKAAFHPDGSISSAPKSPQKMGALERLRIFFMQQSSQTGRSIRSEEHTSELQSPTHLVCRLLLEKKKHE